MDLWARSCRSVELGSLLCRGEMFIWIPVDHRSGSGPGRLAPGPLELDVGGEGVGRDAAQAPDGEGLDIAGGEEFIEQAAADAEALGSWCDGEKERLLDTFKFTDPVASRLPPEGWLDFADVAGLLDRH